MLVVVYDDRTMVVSKGFWMLFCNLVAKLTVVFKLPLITVHTRDMLSSNISCQHNQSQKKKEHNNQTS